MKKFKTKKTINNKIIVFLIMFFMILFVLLSYFNLSSSYSKLVSYLLNSFDKKNGFSINFLTSNLDNLIYTYSFIEKSEIVFKDSRPLVYIYNTHDNEKYRDNTSVYSGAMALHNNLNKLGIESIVEERKVSSLMYTGLSQYDISRNFINDIKSNYNSIRYYVDIHRDSVSDTKIIINNKKYAKIMFVLGLDNPNYLKNKDILVKMNKYLDDNYPGLSKGIYEKQGSSVNGIYNQDISENVLLIEIGGIDNNFEEVNNSTEIISLMLYYMLGD